MHDYAAALLYEILGSSEKVDVVCLQFAAAVLLFTSAHTDFCFCVNYMTG